MRRGREHQADEKRGPGGDAWAHPRRGSSVSSTATTAATTAICPNVDAVPQPAPTALAISVATAKATMKNPSWASLDCLTTPPRASDRREGLVLAEHALHRPADLTERAVCVHRLDDRGHEVLLTLRGGPKPARARSAAALSRSSRSLLELLALTLGERRVDAEVLGLRLVIVAVLVHADDDALALVDILLPLVGLVEDRLVVVAGVDRLDEAYKWEQDVNEGERVVVGVNKYRDDDEPQPEYFRVDPALAERQREKLEKLRDERDSATAERRWPDYGPPRKVRRTSCPRSSRRCTHTARSVRSAGR